MYYYAFVSLLKASVNDSETYLITTHCKVVPLKAVIHNIDIVIARKYIHHHSPTALTFSTHNHLCLNSL